MCHEYANRIIESPEVFALDEENRKVVALITEPNPAQYEEVRAVEASYPVRAILLTG